MGSSCRPGSGTCTSLAEYKHVMSHGTFILIFSCYLRDKNTTSHLVALAPHKLGVVANNRLIASNGTILVKPIWCSTTG